MNRTIRARIHESAVKRVTRIYAATLADIFAELLQNARRADAARVRISVERAVVENTDPDGETQFAITVTDDGSGIADPAVLLSFGENGWSDELVRLEDAAGFGFASLARRGCAVSSRPRSTDGEILPGWRVDLAAEHFLGEGEASILAEDGAPYPHGTSISFVASEALAAIRNAAENAARHYPLPVIFADRTEDRSGAGEELPRRAFLDGSVHAEPWRGLVFGVFRDRRHGYNDPDLNFHGLTLPVRLPTVETVHGSTWTVRADVMDCPDLELVLPARKEAVENGFLTEMREAARLAVYRAMAADPAGPGGAADRFGVGFDRLQAQSRTMTARDALLGSSFSLTGQRDGAGGSLAFWGRASQGSFDGAERGDGRDISLDGTVTTGMLGADYARGNWLVGLALTQSSSEGSYAAIGGEGDGDVEASLTAAIPYAALRASERLKLWGAAGYGSGEVTLKTAPGSGSGAGSGERLSADTSWTMAAAGVRGDLLTPPADGSGGPALALTSDALWARTSSEKTGELAATDSDVTRLRLGLEGSYRIAMEGNSHLTPKLEIGARHDGGDAETGFGVEVGGGIAWVDPSLGLSLDVSGRTLLAHENDDLKDRGFSAALGFDPAPATQRGPSLSLHQDFGGQAQGGLDALFAPDPLEDRTGSEATSRWAMEAAYGLPVFGDRFTGSPHVGFGLSTGARDYSLGWRLTPEAATAPDLSFGIRATRRESDAAEAEYVVGFEAVARW